MAAVIARVTGTALSPGISRNGRLYTREAIGKAVARAKDRIADGKRPITMRSHHAGGDDSLRVTGRVDKMWQDPDTGAARYEAAIADTPAGQVIKALTDDTDGQPAFLRGVSIRGGWMEEPHEEQVDGRAVTTASDLAIEGLDFTAEPGVDDADVSHLPGKDGPGESADGPAYPITESAPEALVSVAVPSPTLAAQITESGMTLNQMHTELGLTPLPGVTGSVPAALDALQALIGEAAKPLKSGKAATPQTDAKSYADPGYQPDKMKRYALDSKPQALAAWRYVHQAKNAKNYTDNQLKRIKGRITKALKAFGVEVNTAEHYLVLPAAQITESTTLAECMACYDGDGESKGSFYVTLTNGPVSVSVSSYVVDPADLDLIGRAAMDGACKAMAAVDPDMDGDMDVPGAPAEDTDDDMPGGGNDPSSPVPGTACPCGCGCAIPVDPDAANCPCACDDCDVCGSTPREVTGETVGPQPTPDADAPTLPITISVESVQTPAPDPAAEPITETEEPAVSEPTMAVEPTQAAAPTAAPAAPTFTFEQMMALLAAARQPAEAAPAPAAPVAEAVAPAATTQPAPAPPASVAETQEQMFARMIAESNRSLIQTLAESGQLPGRRGLTAQSPAATAAGHLPAPLAEGVNSYGMPAGAPDKPLHEYSSEELNRWAGPMVFDHAVGHYANRRG